MSEIQEKYHLYNLLLTLSGIAFIYLFLDWFVYTKFILSFDNKDYIKYGVLVVSKYHPYALHIRVIFITLIFLAFYLKPKSSYYSKPNHGLQFLSLLILGLFIYGYFQNEFYNKYFFWTLPFLSIWAVGYLSVLLGGVYKDENIFGISNEKTFDKMFYMFKTDKGRILKVHSAEQHLYIEGGSGAGKGGTFINTTVYQSVNKGHAALIYDFKGTISEVVHSAFVNASIKKKKIKTKLRLLSFGDITRTYRANPFHSDYVSTIPEVTGLIVNFLKNTNPEWIKKDDIWFRSARVFWTALVMRIYNDESIRHYLSFPILFELFSTDNVKALLNFVNDDVQAKKMMASINMTTEGNIKQFTGTYTSSNSFIPLFIDNKELYWILSANEINLDINDFDNPTVLCIADLTGDSEVYTPLIATIITTVMKNFKKKGQKVTPTLFQLDEIYTLYLDNLPELANTFRENHVSMQIGNQLYSMLVDRYGREKANNIKGACGNQFYGMSNDGESAEKFVKLLSDIDRHNVSHSTSDNSQSISQSLKRQKAIEIRDIVEQPTGHFTGKIANGKPAFFREQFELFSYKKHKIPQFVLKDQSLEELNQKVEKNYSHIVSAAQTFLMPYIETEDPIGE